MTYHYLPTVNGTDLAWGVIIGMVLWQLLGVLGEAVQRKRRRAVMEGLSEEVRRDQ